MTDVTVIDGQESVESVIYLQWAPTADGPWETNPEPFKVHYGGNIIGRIGAEIPSGCYVQTLFSLRYVKA